MICCQRFVKTDKKETNYKTKFFKGMHSNFDQSLKLSDRHEDSPSQVFSLSFNIKWCCIHRQTT